MSKDPRLDRIEQILWTQWDPIGVNHEPGAYGEYDCYAARVLAMCLRGATAGEVEEYLIWASVQTMGLAGGPVENIRQVAALCLEAARQSKL